MNWLDGAILITLALGAFLGAVSGAFWQVARIVMVGSGAVASLRWGGWASEILANRFSDGVAAVLGYFLVFFFSCMAVYVVSFVVDQGIRASELKGFDRGMGAALGGAKALAAVVVALAGLSMYPTPQFSADVQGSLVAPALLKGAKALMPVEARERVQAVLDDVQRRLEPLYGRTAPDGAKMIVAPAATRSGARR